MSIPKRMTVNCSECGKPFSVTVFESVNSDYADDIAMQIISGELFNAECPHCKFVSHLEYDILYHDMRHGAMVWAISPELPDYTKKLTEVRTMQKLPYKTLRIVDDINALREKVSCLENNRDDRIIELCKVFCAYNILSKRTDFDFRNAFYTTGGDKELIFLYDNDGNDICCELPDKAYDYLKDLYYNSHYATQFDDNYPIVDYNWAENILSHLLETEAGKLSVNEKVEENTKSVNDTSTDDKKICPKCKTDLSSDSKFCRKCGTKLSSPIPEPVPSNDAAEDHKQKQENQQLLELQRQEEFERHRIAEIQNERNLAIMKRAAATEAANKRMKIVKIIVACVAVAIIAIGIIVSGIQSAHNSELRNFATETMNDDYTNVYADVVSVEPEYFVYKYNATRSGVKYGNGNLWEVVCKCKTVEGKTIWATFFYQYYPEGNSSENEDDYKSLTFSSANPLRLIGSVYTAHQVVDELEAKIGNVFVLSVKGKTKTII